MKPASAVTLHPHDFQGYVPDRLPADVVRDLSKLRPAKAIAAIIVEWIAIIIAIALCERFWNPFSYALAIVWISARQQALTILGHDVAHYRLFSNRTLNDWVGNITTLWPTFLAADGYRFFHGDHHRFTGTPEDGNRKIWFTHTPEGNLRPEWTYPKTALGLVWTIMRRAMFVTGIFWILRGLIATILMQKSVVKIVARLGFYAAGVAIMAEFGLLRGFLLYWIVPYCTWHIALQYIRLICEHSAIQSEDPAYAVTRTTMVSWWERWLVLPRNIHYHIEHHWYPSVPFYNLPELHQRLQEQPGFRKKAVITSSVAASLRQCIAFDE
ncbi:MAG TPA: fatty acid desaturase family protein [Terriglobia bacterium]|nr:fatty acid desaturase family protein [Terriglobia bacterium]